MYVILLFSNDNSSLCLPLNLLYFSVRFKEGSCDGPFTLTPQENLTITHVTSTTTSVFCQDLALSGWDSINSKQREVCVKLIKNQLDCSQRLEYRVRNYDASPSKVWQWMNTSFFYYTKHCWIASRWNIFRNSQVPLSYRENNNFVSLLCKKNMWKSKFYWISELQFLIVFFPC